MGSWKETVTLLKQGSIKMDDHISEVGSGGTSAITENYIFSARLHTLKALSRHAYQSRYYSRLLPIIAKRF